MYSHYVVFKGHNIGIYTNWEECNAQVKGFPGGKFMGFLNLEDAEEAWAQGGGNATVEPVPSSPLAPSITTKAGCNASTGEIRYQGVLHPTKEVLFQAGPYQHGTSYIAEFLSIVHALAYAKQQHSTLPIYSVSQVAIDWVKQCAVRTSHQRTLDNQALFAIVDRAENWLKTNSYTNQVLRWHSRQWGENPAEFAR